MRKPFTEDQIADIADADMRIERIYDEAEKMLAEEGAFHVLGVYYAKEGDATFMRMLEAEKRVRERDRAMDRWIAEPRMTA